VDTVHECDRQTDRQTELLSQIPCNAEHRTVKRLNAFEMDMYRRMMRISWREHRTNNSIIVELQPTCRFLAEVKRRKLQYFGHVVRADNLCTQFYMVPLPETDVEEDHGDAGLMISNNGQEYP